MNEKIIYILGAGRSGTTLLDIILGNEPQFFSAGELNRIPKRNFSPHLPRDENVYKFWNHVKASINNYESEYSNFQKLEYHFGFIHVLKKRKSLKKYIFFNKELFKSIVKESKKPYIIDSSKYPLRAYWLSKIYDKEICFIYMKRHPLATVNSFGNKSVEQPHKSNYYAHFYLLFVNILSNIIFNFFLPKKSKKCIIHLEDLSSNCLKSLLHIESSLGLELKNLIKKVENNQSFDVGFLFDGNRLRLRKKITLVNNNNKKRLKVIDKFLLSIHKFFWYY